MAIDIDYINYKVIKNGDAPFKLSDFDYSIKTDGEYLLDSNGQRIGTKGDFNSKILMDKILREGCWDENPRPKYETDAHPAYTLSLNNVVNWTYDLSKNESPLITLRPIYIKKAIGEVLWIYQDQSTNLNVLADKYNVTWWDLWSLLDKDGKSIHDIGPGTYGATIKQYDQINNLINGIKSDPDSRRHMTNMWQWDQFKKPHGLKPCAYETVWNVRHGRDGVDYLDMKLIQRSSDFMVAGCINQMQYLALLYMVARECGYTPGKFTWDVENIQIYDRHIKQALEQLKRDPVECSPILELNEEKESFYDITMDDFKVKDYPTQLIKKRNPQQTFDKGV